MLGPTAAGKSDAALAAASSMGAEIVSVDSMQVYRGMDIGTAKPSAAARDAVRHHLVDVADPADDFTVAEFQAAGRAVLDDTASRRVPVVITGGSGLHFRSLVDPLRFPPTDATVRAEVEGLPLGEAAARLLAVDPRAGDHVDMANPRRVVRALEIHRLTGLTPSERARAPEAVAVREYRPLVPVVAFAFDPGERLAERVAGRFDAMLERGLLDEVAALAPRMGRTARAAVGYRQLLPVVEGRRSLESGRRRAIDATTALARRQRTFFRRDPRIRWLEWQDDPGERIALLARALEEAGWIS